MDCRMGDGLSSRTPGEGSPCRSGGQQHPGRTVRAHDFNAPRPLDDGADAIVIEPGHQHAMGEVVIFLAERGDGSGCHRRIRDRFLGVGRRRGNDVVVLAFSARSCVSCAAVRAVGDLLVGHLGNGTRTLSKASLAPPGIVGIRSTRLTAMPRPAPASESACRRRFTVFTRSARRRSRLIASAFCEAISGLRHQNGVHISSGEDIVHSAGNEKALQCGTDMINADHVGDGIGNLIENLRFQMDNARIARQAESQLLISRRISLKGVAAVRAAVNRLLDCPSRYWPIVQTWVWRADAGTSDDLAQWGEATPKAIPVLGRFDTAPNCMTITWLSGGTWRMFEAPPAERDQTGGA
jgi:hypothetical protein